MEEKYISAIAAYLIKITEELGGYFASTEREVTNETRYKRLAIEIGWGTLYLNSIWLLNNYKSEHVLYWQIAMTQRLVCETVSDTSYALKKSTPEQLERFFSYLDKDFTDPETLNQYMEGMKEMGGNRARSLGSSTMARINETLKTTGIVNYNILSQFSHLNTAGFCQAYVDIEKPGSLRKTTPSMIHGLAKEMKEVIVDELSLDDLNKAIRPLEEELEKLSNDYMRGQENE